MPREAELRAFYEAFRKGDVALFDHKAKLRARRIIIADKIKEACASVMPIVAIVLVLCATIVPLESGTFLVFLLGAFLAIVGIGLFTLGADSAMTEIGEYIGTSTMRTKKVWLIVPIFFVVGVMITVAEPDLQLLATQLSETVNNWVLLISVGIGVGLFLVVAFLRILLKIKLKWILLIFYTAVFIMSFFVPQSFVPLAFDSGGVTTGPISVPVIISIGTGIAALRSDGTAEEDSFGLTALCSIGPILAVMILGLIYNPESFKIAESTTVTVLDSKELFIAYGQALPIYLEEVAIGLAPILAFFIVFRFFGSKIDSHEMIKIGIGVVYTYVGLVMFLLGVNVGFFPVGTYIGETIGKLPYNWIMIFIGFIIGFFVVAAEPAVHVLKNKVFEITAGAIPQKALSLSLMIGVGVSVGLAMMRIILQIPILYFLIPAYLISLTLMFVVPEMFTGIAFDSGGVASGAMTAGFVLPLALGLCRASGGDIATDGFGVVAFVAMTPLITLQILGLVFKLKRIRAEKSAETDEPDEIID
ncbi:MAG: DUF1538 domain-containing protein [Clostridia bacterium]|nr:DUF1538 domain-containing protein [Clostridia bacterium]